jgi:hypothetical protein
MKPTIFKKIAISFSISLVMIAGPSKAEVQKDQNLCPSLKSYLSELHKKKMHLQTEIQATRDRIKDYESSVFGYAITSGGVVTAVTMATVHPLVGLAALGGSVLVAQDDCAEEDLSVTIHQLQNMKLPLGAIDTKYIEKDRQQYIADLQKVKQTRENYRDPVGTGKNFLSLGYAESNRLRLYLENQETEFQSLDQREESYKISYRRSCLNSGI